MQITIKPSIFHSKYGTSKEYTLFLHFLIYIFKDIDLTPLKNKYPEIAKYNGTQPRHRHSLKKCMTSSAIS